MAARQIGQKDIDKAFMEQHAGMEMPIEEFDEGQRRVLAYHEAGHAIAQYYVMPDQKIVRATIVRLSTGPIWAHAAGRHGRATYRASAALAYDIIVAFAGR